MFVCSSILAIYLDVPTVESNRLGGSFLWHAKLTLAWLLMATFRIVLTFDVGGLVQSWFWTVNIWARRPRFISLAGGVDSSCPRPSRSLQPPGSAVLERWLWRPWIVSSCALVGRRLSWDWTRLDAWRPPRSGISRHSLCPVPPAESNFVDIPHYLTRIYTKVQVHCTGKEHNFTLYNFKVHRSNIVKCRKKWQFHLCRVMTRHDHQSLGQAEKLCTMLCCRIGKK